VDLLSGQSILGVEGVDAAQRNLNAAACRRKAAPGAEMSSANQNLDQDGNFGNVLTLHLDFEVGQRGHELLVEPANPIPSLVGLAPRFFIVARSFAEGPKHTFQIMLVLESDVLLNNCNASGHALIRSGWGGHSHLRAAGYSGQIGEARTTAVCNRPNV